MPEIDESSDSDPEIRSHLPVVILDAHAQLDDVLVFEDGRQGGGGTGVAHQGDADHEALAGHQGQLDHGDLKE